MNFGQNLQHLRKAQGNMTQEKLAERLGVTRQAISKWENGEVYPEVSKLMELCDVFSCTMDALLRDNLSERAGGHSPIRLVRIQGFRYASQLIISKDAVEHSRILLSRWLRRSGLEDPVILNWNFPQLSQEQKQRFGLRGNVCAAVLPRDFESWVSGPDLAQQETADYAVMTLRDPCASPHDRVSGAYGQILEYLSSTPDAKKKHSEGVLPCFQRLYEKDGVEYMDVYVHCQCLRNPDAAVDFVKDFT